MRLHRYAQVYRWTGGNGSRGPEHGSIFKKAILVLRKAIRPDEGTALEEDGFVLLYKRLENGRFKWPRTEEQVRYITWQEFRWLTEGLSIDQPKAIRKAKIGDVI